MLELEFKQHNQTLTKFLKWIVRNILPDYKSWKMHIYCKKCNKRTFNTFPKKLVSTWKNKIKGKSKCAICLTEITFIHEIKYDVDSKLEIYLQFFTDWYSKNEDYLLC